MLESELTKMLFIRLLLAVFAAFRLSTLLAEDNGPFDCFYRLRRYLGIRAGENSIWKTLADLVHCPYCSGVWFSAFAVLLVVMPSPGSDFFLFWLGIAGAQAFLLNKSVEAE